jgi:diaminopimelate epimerase
MSVTRLKQVVVTRPGGNDTALVFDVVDARDYKELNAYIQSKKPEIEQVMFVENEGVSPKGMMAGGEFCGNATRSLGYYLLKGKNGTIDVSVSGAKTPLSVTVKDKSARTQIPIINDAKSVTFLNDTDSLVRLEGITHLVLESGSEDARKIAAVSEVEKQKLMARQLLEKHDLMEQPAAGVMVLSRHQNAFKLLPFVYVKAVDTFYAETACGSGSVAVGLVFAKKQGKPIHDVEIQQPSGQFLMVNVNYKDGSFETASIEGKVEILYEGPV